MPRKPSVFIEGGTHQVSNRFASAERVLIDAHEALELIELFRLQAA